MNKTLSKLPLAGMLVWGQAQADYSLNMPVGVTETSKDIHDLHMLIMWICVAIGVVVYGLITYSIIYHRKSKGVVPATFHENTKLEIVWTIIPFLILFAMAVPATKVMIKAYDTSASDITIKVTGYQWKWRYTYLDEGIDFFSTLDAKSNEARQLGSKIDPTTVDKYLLNVDHPLVIPVNKKVRILMTSADVIHAWWVPEFGWKKDAIPGFVTDGWVKVEKTGIYRGQCTELCGRDHGFMPIVVEVKSEVDYAAWIAAHKPASAQVKAPPAATTAPSAQLTTTNATLATQTLSRDELLTKGKEVYDGNCAGCHGANGEGIAGAFPAIKGSAVATGPVSEHLGVVYKGKRAMPAFGELLNPTQIASVVTYQRNALGNSQGDLLQPSDVQVQN